MSVGHLAEKLIIVSNNHGRTQKCNVSVFDQRDPFGQSWSKKQNCEFKLNLAARLI